MSVIVSKNFLNNPTPKPDHDIDVKDKDKDWILKNIKYIYGQYLAGQCGITPEEVNRIELLRLYMNGKQPHDIYRRKYLSENENKNKSEYGHIAWDKVYNPMPKVIDRVIGLFISQDHNVVANCNAEFSEQYKIKDYATKYTAIKLSDSRKLLNSIMGLSEDEDPRLNPLFGFMERDLHEIELVASAGGFKIPYEVAAEKALEQTQKVSQYRFLKRKAIRDLLLGYIALRDDVSINETHIKWSNVDITDVIVEYSSKEHFNKSRYVAIQEFWTIEDLRKKGFKEEELKHIAGIYHNYNMKIKGRSDRVFQFYSTYYPATKSYGYDDYIIPVLYCEFKSVDTKYSKKVKTPTCFDDEYMLYKSDFGKLTQDTVVDFKEMVYKGRWIMETDSVFDDGILRYIPRDSTGSVNLSIHIAKVEGASMIERVVQTLDELAMLGYKLQNTLAKSQGKQPMFDFSAIENITSNTGGKLDPFDIIDMYMQNSGVPTRSIPLDESVNYPRHAPVIELEGGMGAYLNELLTLRQTYLYDLIDLSGLVAEQISDNTPVGIAQIAVANMTDVLKPLYDLYLEVKEKVCYNTIYRIQLLIHHNKKAFEYYKNVIGQHYAKYLEMAYDTEPLDMGISFEAMPTQQMKEAVLGAAAKGLQVGKNGVPIINMSEYLYIVDRINTVSGIKEARLRIEYREQQDEIMASQRQRQAIEMQGQQIQEQIALKGAMEQAKANANAQAKAQNIQLDRDLELRNKEALQGNDAILSAAGKSLDYSLANEGMNIAEGEEDMEVEQGEMEL